MSHEGALIDVLVKCPHYLEDDATGDPEPSLFSDDRDRRIYQAITTLWETDRPEIINLNILCKQLPDIDPLYIGSLVDGRPHPIEDYRVIVRELRIKREMRRILKVGQEESAAYVKTGTIADDAIAEIVRRAKAIESLRAPSRQEFDPATVLLTGTELRALDIYVEWTVGKLIPSRGLTLLHGPSGVGKSWLAWILGEAVAEGRPFLGLETIRRPVIIIDRENPASVLHDRACTMNIRNTRCWPLAAKTPPPKLDSDDWTLYKKLPPGNLLVYDTCRSFHDGEENSDRDAAIVMNRLKEIRELGNDIILLFHTPRISERRPRGAQTWEDLADHVVAFYRIDRKTGQEIDCEDDNPDATLYLGTGRKTRYEPFHLYVTLNTAAGTISPAEDPNLPTLAALEEYIQGQGNGKNQNEIIRWAKAEKIGMGKTASFLTLLARGARDGRWHIRKDGQKKLYEP